MVNLKSVQLSKKLPLFIVGFSILIGATLIVVSLLSFQGQAFRNVQQQMSSMVADRRAAVQQLMNSIQSDLLTLGASPATGNALSAFGRTWAEMDGAASALTAAYINNNPNQTGQANHALTLKLDHSGGADQWSTSSNNGISFRVARFEKTCSSAPSVGDKSSSKTDMSPSSHTS